MGLPRKLKNFNLFNDGVSCLGEIAEVTPPKISIKGEKYRGGGMLGSVTFDMGLEDMEMECAFGGHMTQPILQFGQGSASGVMWRMSGAYQRDDTGDVDAVDLIVRGRILEIDRGNAKPGENVDFKVKMALTFYTEIVNGVPLMEIDVPGGIYIVGGIDRMAEHRKAMGI